MSKVKEIVKCSVEHCDNKVVNKGMCGKHYRSNKEYGDPLYIEKNGLIKRKVKNKPLPYEHTHKIINGIEHKLCRTCEKWLPMNDEHFYKNKSKSSKDGYVTNCKQCTKDKAEEWRKNPDNREKFLAIKRKRNQHPDHKKELQAAYERRKIEGYMIDYQRNNRDKFREYQENRKKNKKHEISKREWESCKEYFNHECAYCGMSEMEHKEIHKQQLHKEHVNHTGANDLSNCVPSCKSCNGQKNTKEFNEWYNEDNLDFTIERLKKIKQWLEEDYKQYIIEKKPRKTYTRKNIAKNT